MSHLSKYQSGKAGIEIFSPSGSDPLKCLKVKNESRVQRIYERSVKGYVLSLEQESSATSVECPRSTKNTLGIIQPYLVFQLKFFRDKSFSLELVVLDNSRQRRRLYLSTNFKDFDANALQARLAFTPQAYDEWQNVVLDLKSLTAYCFPGCTFESISSFTLHPACVLRKIFSLPFGFFDNNPCQLPPQLDYPVGVKAHVHLFEVLLSKNATSRRRTRMTGPGSVSQVPPVDTMSTQPALSPQNRANQCCIGAIQQAAVRATQCENLTAESPVRVAAIRDNRNVIDVPTLNSRRETMVTNATHSDPLAALGQNSQLNSRCITLEADRESVDACEEHLKASCISVNQVTSTSNILDECADAKSVRYVLAAPSEVSESASNRVQEWGDIVHSNCPCLGVERTGDAVVPAMNIVSTCQLSFDCKADSSPVNLSVASTPAGHSDALLVGFGALSPQNSISNDVSEVESKANVDTQSSKVWSTGASHSSAKDGGFTEASDLISNYEMPKGDAKGDGGVSHQVNMYGFHAQCKSEVENALVNSVKRESQYREHTLIQLQRRLKQLVNAEQTFVRKYGDYEFERCCGYFVS